MERRQLRRSTSKSDDWIKCQSKKRPNQFYMFNKATGETKWCSDLVDDRPMTTRANERKTSPMPPICTSKSIRTPAQDRLKRLQNNLKREHKEKLVQKPSTTSRRRSQDQDSCIKKENESGKPKEMDIQKHKKSNIQNTTSSTGVGSDKDALPSTSKSALLIKLEMDKNNKSTTIPKDRVGNKSYKNSPKREATKRPASNSTNDTAKSKKRPKQELPLQEKGMPNTTESNDETIMNQSTSTALSIGSGFVNKIKAICKRTFSGYRNVKKALSQKHLEPCIKKTNFKIPQKDTVSRPSVQLSQINEQIEKEKESEESDVSCSANATSTPAMAIVMKGTATPSNGQTTVDFKAIALTASPSQIFGTPNNLVVPAYERGSANTRLNRLRQSLHQHALSNDEEINTPARLCASACSSALACVIRDSTMNGNNTTVEDDEAMDWMPVEDLKTETIELSSNESSNATPSIRSQEPENMGEYYGTVNGNLLRYAVEQRLGSTSATGKWLNDFYYFVLDTNVLLQHLTFIEDLSHMKLCDTSGTVLYIPYCVLQELDKLKQFAVGDGTKVLAVRAIKYLNSKFESKNKHLQAQSALSELEHLVEVSSPDDRIINCCLQAKQHVEHVILLTEDINLRTKAICNNILVSTKSDLLAKHT